MLDMEAAGLGMTGPAGASGAVASSGADPSAVPGADAGKGTCREDVMVT